MASASCVGPTIRLDQGDVSVGDIIEVEGLAWGDNCYDTGPPPEGEGSLGNPRSDISIVLIQGDVEIIVANGNADGEYAFLASVTVPDGLIPGEFSIETRPRGAVETQGPLVFVESDQRLAPMIEQFGPDEPVLANDATGSSRPVSILAIALPLFLVIALLLYRRRGRSKGRV